VAFTSIRLYHFRNLRDTTIRTDAREVFLVGANGQGKTNFLEAIYFVCYAASFRTRRDEVMRTDGADDMAVEARFSTDAIPHTVVVKQVGRRKNIELDGSTVSDRKEIVGNIPCIVFCHDDIAFVTGPPDMQRWFMNQTQTLLDPDYIPLLRRYAKVLKARNAALKERRTDLLDVLDHQLVETGRPIVRQRSRLAATFNRNLATLFSRVFDPHRRLDLVYSPSWEDPDDEPANIHQELAAARPRDLELRTSTRGPHRDRFVYRLDGRILSDVASTGQLRLVSLILRVAQADLLAQVTGRLPVLLLDDVLLELDPHRRQRFVESLPEYEQAFFTFLPDEQYARFRNESTRLYRVREGTIEES
jgi:DNA replication and repair protein RecF